MSDQRARGVPPQRPTDRRAPRILDGEHPASGSHGRLGHGSHERSGADGCGHLVLGRSHYAAGNDLADHVRRGARRDPRHLHHRRLPASRTGSTIPASHRRRAPSASTTTSSQSRPHLGPPAHQWQRAPRRSIIGDNSTRLNQLLHRPRRARSPSTAAPADDERLQPGHAPETRSTSISTELPASAVPRGPARPGAAPRRVEEEPRPAATTAELFTLPIDLRRHRQSRQGRCRRGRLPHR